METLLSFIAGLSMLISVFRRSRIKEKDQLTDDNQREKSEPAKAGFSRNARELVDAQDSDTVIKILYSISFVSTFLWTNIQIWNRGFYQDALTSLRVLSIFFVSLIIAIVLFSLVLWFPSSLLIDTVKLAKAGKPNPEAGAYALVFAMYGGCLGLYLGLRQANIEGLDYFSVLTLEYMFVAVCLAVSFYLIFAFLVRNYYGRLK